MSPQHYDCIVIGAGILGCFHAYHAAQKGLSVLLIEKDQMPSEASVRNFGQIVPSGMSAGKWQEFGRRSVDLYQSIQSVTDISIRHQGTLYVASDDTELQLIHELNELNRQNGYPSTLLSPSECIARNSFLKREYCKGGIFFANELNAEPGVLIRSLLPYLENALGITYMNRTCITSVEEIKGSIRVTSATGFLASADKVIICTGRDFQYLFPEECYAANIQVTRLQMMRTVPQPHSIMEGSILSGLSIRRYESFRECPSFDSLNAATIDPEFKEHGIHILFKQSPDGSVIIGDSHHYAAADKQSELGFTVDMHVNNLILKEAMRMADLPSWEIAQCWNGYYGQMPDGEYFHQEVEPGIHVVTAIGGKGMTAGPGLAEFTINNLFS